MIQTDVSLKQHAAWMDIKRRLVEKNLVQGELASISTRIPGTSFYWFAFADDDEPELFDFHDGLVISGGERGNGASAQQSESVHALIYSQRLDVGNLVVGHGTYGGVLVEHVGEMPGIFDEQIRHLGLLRQTGGSCAAFVKQLHTGTNILSTQILNEDKRTSTKQLIVLGMTAQRLILNAGLMEKCSNAYALAYGTRLPISQIPWLIRFIANRRLTKDQKQAA